MLDKQKLECEDEEEEWGIEECLSVFQLIHIDAASLLQWNATSSEQHSTWSCCSVHTWEKEDLFCLLLKNMFSLG